MQKDPTYDVEWYIIDRCDIDSILETEEDKEELIAFLRSPQGT